MSRRMVLAVSHLISPGNDVTHCEFHLEPCVVTVQLVHTIKKTTHEER